MHVSLPEDVGRLGCKDGVLLERVIGPGVALGIGVSVSFSLHFLKKCVILPNPTTLIQYW